MTGIEQHYAELHMEHEELTKELERLREENAALKAELERKPCRVCGSAIGNTCFRIDCGNSKTSIRGPL